MSLKKAIELANEKKFNQAKEMLEELAKEYPNDPDILYNLGMCYTELNNPEKAIEVLTKGIVIAPELVNSHVALGFAFTKLGDLIEAESHFRNALEIQPDNSYALRNLGGLLAKKKDYEGAIEFLIKSLMKHPDDMRTTYGLGLAYFHTKKLNEADEQFKIVISNSNDNYLIDHAKEIIDTPSYYDETLNQITENYESSVESINGDINSIKRLIIQLETRRKGYYRLLAEDNGDKNILQDELRKVEDEIENSNKRITELSNEIIELKGKAISADDIKDAFNNLDNVWGKLVVKERTRLMHLIYESIIFRPENESVDFNLKIKEKHALQEVAV